MTGDEDPMARVRAVLLWVESGQPERPEALAGMTDRELSVLTATAELCEPEVRDRLLGRTGH